MVACPACGVENRVDARFCDACGAAMTVVEEERRKVVSVLFCDVVGRARCLPYGAGITYWPVVEVIKQLGVLPSDPAAAAAIRSLLGETAEGTSAEEIAWAFRKLLEEQAPLVVVFDDIQWGEETFLDLVERVRAAVQRCSDPVPLPGPPRAV